jgi:tetratricopeptide (TPR) repeat protein
LPPTEDRSTAILRVICSLVVFALVPAVYIQARCQHEIAQFLDLRQQSRFAEANDLLHRMLALDDFLRHNGTLLRREQHELQHTIETLRQRTQTPITASANIDERLQYARDLAMLGHPLRARDMLLKDPSSIRNSQACTLLATIHENLQDWNSALDFYGMAESQLQPAPGNADIAAQSYRIRMGKAYCCRRIGRLHEARMHYLSLLTFDSGASTHFLLAQFFEDIQETSLAVHHARLAMQRDPHRYGDKGLQLIRKMQSSHFGCFRLVFSARLYSLPGMK